MKVSANIGKIAIINDFRRITNFDLFSSNSNAPSITIRTSPMVPNSGNSCWRFGISNSKKSSVCLASQPKTSNSITEGILVTDEVISNRYAKSKRVHNVMIIEISMSYLARVSSSEKLGDEITTSAW